MKVTYGSLSKIGLAVTLLGIPGWAKADKAGQALLQKCVDAMTQARTFQADFTLQTKDRDQNLIKKGTLSLQKPNLANIAWAGKEPGTRVAIHSDGRTIYRYMPSDNEYLRAAVDMSGANVGHVGAKIFFYADTLNQFAAQGSGVKVVGSLTLGNMACKVLQVTGTSTETTYKFYVGTDNLLHGFLIAMGGHSEEYRFTNVKANVPMVATTFAWKLPKGAKPYQETPISTAARPEATSLLAAGKMAPDFTLPLPEGGKVTLSALTRTNKATLLNFWSYF